MRRRGSRHTIHLAGVEHRGDEHRWSLVSAVLFAFGQRLGIVFGLARLAEIPVGDLLPFAALDFPFVLSACR